MGNVITKNNTEKKKRLLWIPPGYFHQELHYNGVSGKNELRNSNIALGWKMERIEYKWGPGLDSRCETQKRYTYSSPEKKESEKVTMEDLLERDTA